MSGGGPTSPDLGGEEAGEEEAGEEAEHGRPVIRSRYWSAVAERKPYRAVFVPKRRQKAIFGQARRQLGAIFHALARQKECQIIEGHLMPDHLHLCIAIPLKHPVALAIGFPKGKSAITRLSGKERNFAGEPFWVRGYAVSTAGFELEQVRTSIREQETADGAAGQF